MPSIAWSMQDYIYKDTQRLHTPGHKGKLPHPLSEAAKYDLTELENTGSLFAGGPPFDEVENLFAGYYGDGATLLSAGGSTLAVQAMIATFCEPGRPLIMMRGCHSSAISTCALLGLNPYWVAPLPGEEVDAFRDAIAQHPEAAAVYITSPDYFGYIAPVAELAELCEAAGIPLLVDAAQGAHLGFFGRHPVALGATAAATSAHKTLPALTGAALLHLKDATLANIARSRMALFGSTSPSYLILLSLDILSGHLFEVAMDYKVLAEHLEKLRHRLEAKDVLADISPMDPIRLTLDFSGTYLRGDDIGALMKQVGVTPELIWDTRCVLLPAPNTDFLPVEVLINALPRAHSPRALPERLHLPVPAAPLRTALFGSAVAVPTREAAGRVCACIRTVCPPGVPVVLPGEIIDEKVINLLLRSGFDTISVLK